MNVSKTALLILTLASSLSVIAREITPDEALGRLRNESYASMARRAAKVTPSLVHTALTETGQPAAYIFNNGGEGFMVLSADDEAIPVLGYSDSGEFSADNIPPQMAWWLSEYAREIEYARGNNIASSETTRRFSPSGVREAIEPMIKTKWDQISPYNSQCPLDGGLRTYTGCVATAMAQVMNYWQYPEKGTGSITYTIESLEKKVTMNFSQKKFAWDNMAEIYIPGHYTDEQADAVAYLMKACGYSVKMDYSTDASGALAMYIGNALKKYFNYDGNLYYTLREYYSSTEWEQMVYDNLKNVGPILYGGGSTLGGGHSFVCDGYDGEGMFHFNWGWSGMSDGYFALSALNPDALGTGGGTGGGYNFTQDAVFGVQPPTGQPVVEQPIYMTQDGELAANVFGSKLSLSVVNTGQPMWANYNPKEVYVKFGAMFEPQGDAPGEAVYHDISSERLSIPAGYGTTPSLFKPSVNLSELNLSDGTYKVVTGSVILERNAESSATDGTGFQPFRTYYGMSNSAILTVKNGLYSVSCDLLPALKISGEIVGDCYYGMLTRVKVTVENPGDVDRVSGFAPLFLDSEGPLMLGQSIYVDIPAHSTVTREWVTDMTQMVQYFDPYINTPLSFTFFDEASYSFYTGAFMSTVTVLPNPGTPAVTINNLKIANSTVEDNNYVITDPMNIDVSAALRLMSGKFAYPVMACLCKPVGDDQFDILTTAGQNIFMSTNGTDPRTAQFAATCSYPFMESDAQYYIIMAYYGIAGLVPVNIIPLKYSDPNAGISSIVSDSGFTVVADRNAGTVTVTAPASLTSVEAYDLTGRRADAGIDCDGNRAVVYLATSGVAIIRAVDADGNVKVTKIN